MSGPNSPTGALPPETAERVHAYLAAFLSPPAADEALDEVAEDVAFWGDLGHVQVFAAAHRALASRLRIAPEVEVLVLAEDSAVPVDEISQILELEPGAVRAMLDEALAELAEPDEVPETRTPQSSFPEPGDAVVDDGPSSDWPPALVADEPTADPQPEPVEPEVQPVEPEPREPAATAATADGAADTTTEPLVTPTLNASRSALRDATARVTDEVSTSPSAPAGADVDGASRRSAEPSESPARRWVPALLVLGTVLLIAIVVASLAGGEEDPATEGIQSTCQDAPICVTEAVLTETVNNQGVPGEPRETFTLEDDVKLWFTFDRNREGPVTLEARWSRNDLELYRSDFRLASVDHIHLTLAGLFMEEPGAYGVQIVGDGQVLLERTFTVTGAAG